MRHFWVSDCVWDRPVAAVTLTTVVPMAVVLTSAVTLTAVVLTAAVPTVVVLTAVVLTAADCGELALVGAPGRGGLPAVLPREDQRGIEGA